MTQIPRNAPVLITGAGPVGLTLAIDLAQRGVRSILIEKRPEQGMLPKMERVNPRTMEHFRRLGIADEIRRRGLPEDLPMDVFIADSALAEARVRLAQPSVSELRAKGAATNDGSMPAEPYQVISQYTLEPLLKEVADAHDLIDVRFGCELLSFEQHDDRVTARVSAAGKEAEELTVSFLVGCDGASSSVRNALGIELEGDPQLLNVHQGLFRAADLYERLPAKGRHYHVIDDHNTFLIVQDDTRHFTMHSVMESPDQMASRFEEAVGGQVDYEVLFAGAWTMRAMLANSYGNGRVYLAGDAAHLMPPTAGLGMNTGAGDAIDLSWKLAAVIDGWGGPELLASYEAERRPVGAANIAYSVSRFRARQVWRSSIDAGSLATEDGRASIAREASQNEARAGYMEGVELGYSYAGSPIVLQGSPNEDPSGGGIERTYRPSSSPGCRIPHVWLTPGQVAVQDVVPMGQFSLVVTRQPGDVAPTFAAAFGAHGVPFGVVDVGSAATRAVYGDYLLLRPDLHIVWTGTQALSAAEAEEIVRSAIGGSADEG